MTCPWGAPPCPVLIEPAPPSFVGGRRRPVPTGSTPFSQATRRVTVFIFLGPFGLYVSLLSVEVCFLAKFFAYTALCYE